MRLILALDGVLHPTTDSPLIESDSRQVLRHSPLEFCCVDELLPLAGLDVQIWILSGWLRFYSLDRLLPRFPPSIQLLVAGEVSVPYPADTSFSGRRVNTILGRDEIAKALERFQVGEGAVFVTASEGIDGVRGVHVVRTNAKLGMTKADVDLIRSIVVSSGGFASL